MPSFFPWRSPQKDTAYEFFRHHDARTIQMLTKKVAELQESLSQSSDSSDDDLTRQQLVASEQHLFELRYESPDAKEARWAQMHQEMLELHTVGLEDLDFHRTGL